MKFIIRLLITALLVYTLAHFMGGVHVNNFWTAIVFAIVLAILNVIVKPLLVILTLPLTIFTLGLFLLIINTLVVLLASRFVSGFTIDSFWTGFLFSLILSVVSFFISREERKRLL